MEQPPSPSTSCRSLSTVKSSFSIKTLIMQVMITYCPFATPACPLPSSLLVKLFNLHHAKLLVFCYISSDLNISEALFWVLTHVTEWELPWWFRLNFHPEISKVTIVDSRSQQLVLPLCQAPTQTVCNLLINLPYLWARCIWTPASTVPKSRAQYIT